MKATFAIASLLAIAAASPVAPTVTSVPAAEVKICTGKFGTGLCKHYVLPFPSPVPITPCQVLKAPFYKNVGTFELKPYAYCRLWTESDNCEKPNGGDDMVMPPGTWNLHDFEDRGDVGSNVTSFTCQECTNCP